jgi:hypothetical protein
MGGLGVPEIIIILTIMAIPLFVVSLVARFLLSSRRHKERLASIEKGIAIPDLDRPREAIPDLRVYLLRGMIWMFVGIALTLSLLGISLTSERPKTQAMIEIRADVGLRNGTEEDYEEAIKHIPRQYAVPPALCLLGFVPIGVGLAYLLFHRAESRRRDSVADIPTESK